MLQDLRYGVRMLLKHPGFTCVAVLTLALGIGANTAIFSLIDAVLLKVLPVEQPEQLFFVNNTGARGGGGAPQYPCFERFRDRNHYLSGIAAFNQIAPKLTIDGQTEQLKGQFVSGNYFLLLGVKAIVGRTFNPADDSVIGEGGPDGPVAVISYKYWQRRFALSPAVIGKVVQTGKTPVTIIGVTPPGFFGLTPGREVDISLPMMLADANALLDKNSTWFNAVGRLKPGASVEQARAELDAIFRAFMDETAISREARQDYFDHIELIPASRGLDQLRRRFSQPLLTLMTIVGLGLLITCANVANLLLARATLRRREIAVRLALGASRIRLIRQMLTESVLLVSLGGLLGLLVARWSSALLIGFFTSGNNPISLNLKLNGRLLLFTAGLSLLTGVIFGIAPALRATGVDPAPTLKENASTVSSNRSSLRLGKLLVIVQVALSLVLLVGAGLCLRTLRNLKSFDAGFQPEGVVTMRLDAGARDYRVPQLNNFWKEMLARIENLPGVRSASLSVLSPLSGYDQGADIEVSNFRPNAERDRHVILNQVSPDYFTTMGSAIVQGRSFRWDDNESAPKVALLNEAAARFYFSDPNPIGAQLRFSQAKSDAYEIVGVVKDSKHNSLRSEIPRMVYLPLCQSLKRLGNLTLAVRTSSNSSSLVNAVRSEVRSNGADILVTNVVTLREQVEQSLLQERLVSSLSSVVGVLALLLACIGLYGVMACDVTQRRQELGIRMALGARTLDVLKLVIRNGMSLALIGVAVGLAGALALTRLLSSLLFGITPTDAFTFSIVTLGLLLTALLACFIPARRATKVDPLVALRYE